MSREKNKLLILIILACGLSGAWAMGILTGIKLFMIGLIMITGGSAVRELAEDLRLS